MKWHRLFGLTLVDYFTDKGYRVELEKDLSLRQQYLDVVIIEQEDSRPLQDAPDGFENLATHNLLTYKSLYEPLDAWAIDELIGHYVNYRKQISPSLDSLLPFDQFQLYGVCTRHPDKLESEVPIHYLKPGLYETLWGVHRIRIIVSSEVEMTSHNAVWQLFSAIPERVQFGRTHYQWNSLDHSTIINDLFQFYKIEGITMPYTWDDYFRDFFAEHGDEFLARIPPERFLKRLPAEERLKGLPAEERLKGLPAEERLKGLPAEERLKGLSPEDILKCLTREEIEAYLKKRSVSN